MFRGRLVWQIYGWFVVLLVASLGAAAWHATSSMRSFHVKRVEEDLLARATMLAPQAAAALDSADPERVNALCRELGRAADMRVTVIDRSGKVLGENRAESAEMENHLDRPEIVEALAGRPGRSERLSPTLGHRMLYVAVPLRREGTVAAALRVSRSLADVDRELAELRGEIALGGLLVALAAAIVAFGISRRITRPLELMRKGAECFARGELGCKLPTPRTSELASLSTAMNDMARQLDERLRTVTHQRNELEAVLSSMVE